MKLSSLLLVVVFSAVLLVGCTEQSTPAVSPSSGQVDSQAPLVNSSQNVSADSQEADVNTTSPQDVEAEEAGQQTDDLERDDMDGAIEEVIQVE